MDFSTLARRDLQALCKKNKIPANISNVAMADALKALEFVEGIEEVMKPLESETSEVELPENSDMMSSAPPTGRITAVLRTAKKESEISQTMTRTRRSSRKIAPEILDETKNEVALETPAASTGRRRRAAIPKMETLLKEFVDNEEDREHILHEKKDVTKTPRTVMTTRRREVKEKGSVCQGYSTRRSARLAAKLYGSGIQETEASENGTCASLFVEADGVVDINSKLRSLHLDEEHGTVDLTTASGGIENQSLAGKEMTTNGLDDSCVNVESSSGSKESNEVEMGLHEGADLKLKYMADNMAVSEKLDDDEPEVPYTDSSVFCENKNESLARKEVKVEIHQRSEDFATEEIAKELRDIYEIGNERNDDGMVMQEGDMEIQLESQEVFDDDMSKLPNTSEISECVVENADALCSAEVLLVADSTTCLSGNENQTLANEEQNVVVDTLPSSEVKSKECVVKADEPNTNEICGGVMVQPLINGENVEDETSHCLVKEDEEALLLSKQFGHDDTNINEMPSDSEEQDVIINLQVKATIVDDEISDPAVEEGENILLSKQVGNDAREAASESEESEGVIINLQVDPTPMDDEISDGEKDLLQSKELGKTSSGSNEFQEQGVVINLQVGNDGNNTSETASHSEEPEGVIINLQVDTSSINDEISDDEKDLLLSKQLGKIISFDPVTSEDVIICPVVDEDVGDNDGKKKSSDVDEGKNSAMFDQQENGAETFLVVPQQPSSSNLVLFSNDKENIDTSMKLDLTKKKKEGNNFEEMSIRQLCKKLKQFNPYHSQQEEEHEDDDGAPPFRARYSKKQKSRKGHKTFGAQRTAENRPALQQVPHNNCMVGNSKNSSH